MQIIKTVARNAHSGNGGNGQLLHHTTDATATPVPVKPVDNWEKTIERVAGSVVCIQLSQPHAFDGTDAHTGSGTGFVVDAEKGYVLTNRHVVGHGPFWGRIIFHNQDEVDAYAMYRDPVHDFGFLRYDPEAVKYAQVSSIELRPDRAKGGPPPNQFQPTHPNLLTVGVEIKILGNDSGEMLGILSGFISRVDRNAPSFDFNTCYYQANADGSGGSSGSPVINMDGHAVAIMTGGRVDGSSTDYLLPLDMPLRALHRIRDGLPVPRGDVRCVFLTRTFEECRRLGLTDEWEADVRAAYPDVGTNNMLVANTVVPEGPADGKIREGDIVLTINGRKLVGFLELASVFDNNIGQTVRFLVQRGNHKVEEDVLVEDLSLATPDRFVTVAGAGFHTLSYATAQIYCLPCRGVFLCERGSMEFPSRDRLLIVSIDHEATPDLDTFIDVMRRIPDRARVTFTYREISNRHTLRTAVIPINRHWPSKMKLVTRNDTTGLWDFTLLADALPPVAPERPFKAAFPKPRRQRQQQTNVEATVGEITRSIVQVHCATPVHVLIDSSGLRGYKSAGLVLDAARGIVLVSRHLVRSSLCDVTVTIADSIVVPAKVIFLHPTQGYCLIRYDAALVDAPVRSAKLSEEQVEAGDAGVFVGGSDDLEMSCAPTTVTSTVLVDIDTFSLPGYRPINTNVVSVDTIWGSRCGSGALVSLIDGKVLAVWQETASGDSTVCYGLPGPTILNALSEFLAGGETVPRLRMLPAELVAISKLQARMRGVSPERIAEVEADDEAAHRFFSVRRIMHLGTTHASEDGDGLREGDILLTLEDKPVTRVEQLDIAYRKETLSFVVSRGGREVRVDVRTVPHDDDGGMETSHVVVLCGAVLQRPYQAVRQEIKNLPSEVYVASQNFGTPASVYGLNGMSFITHVNDVLTPNLDVLLEVARTIPDNIYFRIRCVSYDLAPFTITIKKCERYFPLTEWRRDASAPNGWRQATHENGEVVDGEGLYGIWC
ncbi:PDZ domain-containing protein [Sodiomyces alkalinus F11]|uniref:Pro-apoptotic serine protease NMA111 n=1 Tax=Sodiomyces alkalinus (strain CBS 110278 / VKM F-3762 / F11) TaxID=1314773 RepID=A0A3N2PNV2_SODAK|nr:PDZ domain-containing protein [Sodiomyces alkalinus F11]ROT36173.1 PDZ domain-containing protein [Sodiomyces alkalinus F11]